MSLDVSAVGRVEIKERAPVAAFLLWTVKTAGMWLALLIASAVAGKLVPINLPMPPNDGPLTLMQAFLVVNGFIAVAVSLVAARARVSGWRLALLLFFAMFAIGSAMMQIETLYFNASIHMPLAMVGQLVLQGAIIAALAGVFGALLFHPERSDATSIPGGMLPRVGAMAPIYVALYYAAGFFIAWQSEAVRNYYSNGMHIELLPTVAFQIFRGTLWALIALFIVARLKGSLASRALVMGMLFFALTATQLLYPNTFVPADVRMAHFVEVGTSEFAYGTIATIVLLAGSARRALAGDSKWRLITGA